MKRSLIAAAIVLLITLIAFGSTRHMDRTDGEAPLSTPPGPSGIERGRMLVLLGNCAPCHTAQGGEPFAGGRAISTRFGTFYSPNITPDAQTGIGGWNSEDFWRALHNGIARDGRPLYPAFPYTSYTKISRQDAQHMFEYMRTIKPVRRASREHEIQFPYNQRLLLSVWRRLYFRPGVYELDATRSAEWNRGAYLVTGVGHCNVCHQARNSLGASRSDENPPGSMVSGWYAPSLLRIKEAGLQRWQENEIVSLLATGRFLEQGTASHAASMMGPMAEVVFGSLQHIPPAELRAMAVYLKSLPELPDVTHSMRVSETTRLSILGRGREIYADNCARCHGDNGEGKFPAAIPLKGNRAVTSLPATNPIRIVLYGGYPAGTAGNPRPFGMPPFSDSLSNSEIADVLTYTRNAWGNSGGIVTANDVARTRTGPLW